MSESAGSSPCDRLTAHSKTSSARPSFDWQAPVDDSERDRLFDSILSVVDKWRLHLPAVLVLESVAPMGHLAGQSLVFFAPFLATLLRGGIYDVQRLVVLLEDPSNLRMLTERIVEAEKHGTRKQ